MAASNHTFPKNNLRKKFWPHVLGKYKFLYNLLYKTNYCRRLKLFKYKFTIYLYSVFLFFRIPEHNNCHAVSRQMSVFMRAACDAQGLVRNDTICNTIFKTRDSQASQCTQCLLSPDDANGHQNFTLNLVTAQNIAASFLPRTTPIISAFCVHFTLWKLSTPRFRTSIRCQFTSVNSLPSILRWKSWIKFGR